MSIKLFNDAQKASQRIDKLVASMDELDKSSKDVSAETESVSAATEEQSASIDEVATASKRIMRRSIFKKEGKWNVMTANNKDINGLILKLTNSSKKGILSPLPSVYLQLLYKHFDTAVSKLTTPKALA